MPESEWHVCRCAQCRYTQSFPFPRLGVDGSDAIARLVLRPAGDVQPSPPCASVSLRREGLRFGAQLLTRSPKAQAVSRGPPADGPG